MRYLHTLDPDELRELEETFWKDVAEQEAEEAAMERYYEEKYND